MPLPQIKPKLKTKLRKNQGNMQLNIRMIEYLDLHSEIWNFIFNYVICCFYWVMVSILKLIILVNYIPYCCIFFIKTMDKLCVI